jgi:hypothetical protein
MLSDIAIAARKVLDDETLGCVVAYLPQESVSNAQHLVGKRGTLIELRSQNENQFLRKQSHSMGGIGIIRLVQA